MRVLEVAVGVIVRDGQFLLSQRRADKDQGGLWEFPGGKCESGETPQQALHRELLEELGINVKNDLSLVQVWHDYQAYQVLLHVFIVDHFVNEPLGREGQPLRWVSLSELKEVPCQPLIMRLCPRWRFTFHQ